MKHMRTALIGTFGALAIPAAIAIKGIDFNIDTFKKTIDEFSGRTQETGELLQQKNTKTTLQRYEEPSL